MEWYCRSKHCGRFPNFAGCSNYLTTNSPPPSSLPAKISSARIGGSFQWSSLFSQPGSFHVERSDLAHQVWPFAVSTHLSAARRFLHPKRPILGYSLTRRWIDKHRQVWVPAVVCSGFAIVAFLTNLETVPYMNRTRFVSVPVSPEFKESSSEDVLKKRDWKVLPGTHPSTLRVKSIADKVIEAFQRSLGNGKAWRETEYASRSRIQRVFTPLWQLQPFKAIRASGASRATNYLEQIDWEVCVVEEPKVNACCMTDGKILCILAF